jgi:cytochrome c5
MVMKLKAITGMVTMALFFGTLAVVSAGTEDVKPSDTAAYYKAKCVMCHGKKAEKKFDASLTEDQMVEAVLKGKKGEKPPHMPAYGEKGVTADQAKALIAHMKELKAAP